METTKIPSQELANRMNRFRSTMDKTNPDWQVCIFTGNMSIYYFTGTICDGFLLIERKESETLWVRKSYERCKNESEFCNIKPMRSFREPAADIKKLPQTLYLDMSRTDMEWYSMLSRYMKFSEVLPVDELVLKVRAVKSDYEIELMSKAGQTIEQLLTKDVPSLLQEGISEAQFGGELYKLFINNGYHGVSRFSMRNSETVLGHIGFGESSLYPSVFNGASGLVGLCPASPVLGSHAVKLKEGDLVYLDVGFGVEGYNVDKTIVYSYKKEQPAHVTQIHNHCLELERLAVSKLRAGAKPSEIYTSVLDAVKPEYKSGFMGKSNVPFIGHGVGLYVDELPVIAKRFDEPLECGMTIALEPKIAIDGVGIAGSENTYLITDSGAVSLTGKQRNLLLIE